MTKKVISFVNVSVNTSPKLAAYVLLWHIKKEKSKRRIHVADSRLYECLMARYAGDKQWPKVTELLSIMAKAEAPLTPQISMFVLDCLGRQSASAKNAKLIETHIEAAGKVNISLDDILENAVFVRDQREKVWEAIRRVRPDFRHEYTPPLLHYTNELVAAHNADTQCITISPSEMVNNSVLCKSSGFLHTLSAEQLDKCIDEQFKAEDMMQTKVKNITVTDSCVNETVLQRRALLASLLEQWKQDIVKVLDIKLAMLYQDMCQNPKSTNIYPYLTLLPPAELASFTLDELLSLMEGSELFTPTVNELNAKLGRRIFERCRLRARQQNGVTEKLRRNYKTYVQILSSGRCSDVPRQLWQRITHHTRNDGPCLMADEMCWPREIQCRLGRLLIDILVNDVMIDANILRPAADTEPLRQKALYTIFRTRDLRSRQEVSPHDVLKRIYDEAKVDTVTFAVNEVPMVCYPLPWLSPKHGGYTNTASALMRLPHKSPIHRLDDVPEQQLYPTLDALNQLGCVPWQMNTRILDLAIDLFRMGGDEALTVPLTPDNLLTDEQLAHRGWTRDRLDAKIAAADKAYHQQQANLYSLYRDTTYKLSLANHFREHVFWLPHSMDFRGRVYPIPPYVTHLSPDLTRSILRFHQRQPLGPFGLQRLKLHCINLTSNKKRASIAERLAYADEVLADIIDSADNPLGGRRWWLDSDDPWQTLAACMEIADAMRSPDPQQFMSGLAIHQDGSCNGLQHYAALGHDTEGAISVNLAVSERPQDVYTTLADLVEKKRRHDAADDNESTEIAAALEGFVDRKVVKQTVMTSVYGVTQMGALAQIRKQLVNKDFPDERLRLAAIYLTKSTLDGLSEMFVSARQIQDWLTNVAKLAAKEKHVRWTTPLGLPIIQPYANDPAKSTAGQPTANRRKQTTAFPPNFVHSLDSTHMMLTALNCHKAGLSFVSVHDCFWTHANMVPEMSRICREQFVLLHTQPIMDDLAQSFLDQNFNNIELERLLKNLPQQGDFDLNNVLKSVYFFS